MFIATPHRIVQKWMNTFQALLKFSKNSRSETFCKKMGLRLPTVDSFLCGCELKTGVILVGVLGLVSSQCLMSDQSGNSRQNLCQHMLIFFWPISSSANTTALIYCRHACKYYIFSLEHWLAAWEHPLPSPSLLCFGWEQFGCLDLSSAAVIYNFFPCCTLLFVIKFY